MPIAAIQHGTMVSAPAASFRRRFSGVGAAAKAKWRSHRQTSSHQVAPSPVSTGHHDVVRCHPSKAKITASTMSHATRPPLLRTFDN